MTKIKFCGITNYKDAAVGLDLGVDALGFNFYAKSPRCISVVEAQTIIRKLPPEVWFVGVFVNHSRDEVEEIARRASLDTLQFHGDEGYGDEGCGDEQLQIYQNWKEWRVIKVFRCKAGLSLEHVVKCKDEVELLLFDSFDEEHFGGTGKEVDPSTLLEIEEAGILKHAFLSGGLTPDNVYEKVKRYKPFGVDVSSGIETRPGKKGSDLMKEFVDAVREGERG